MFFPEGEDDRPKQREINCAIKDWFMTVWVTMLSIFTVIAYPTTMSLFSILVGSMFGISRKIWSVVLSFICVLVSAVGNCFYTYSPFFIDVFNIYPRPALKSWQWIAGSSVAHAVLLIVMILRVWLRSRLTSGRVGAALFTLRARQ